MSSRIPNLPLRWLKVPILSFSDTFLIDNGPLPNSSQKWPIPQTFNVHYVLKNGQFLKKWAIELARRIGKFKIATFSRLSGKKKFREKFLFFFERSCKVSFCENEQF